MDKVRRLITDPGYNEREERTIRQMLAEKNMRRVVAKLNELHPVDIAEYLEYFDQHQRKEIFAAIDDDLAVKIVKTMDETLQFEIAQVLGKDRLVNLLDALPSDEAVDILAQFPLPKVEELLREMEDGEAREARELLRYEDDSAGGIMSADVVFFDETMDVSSCVARIRKHREDLENLSYLYVTDSSRRLTGVVTVKSLVLADQETQLAELMSSDHLVAVRPDDDQEEVAKLVSKYDLLAVPVLDDADRLVGIVHVDDVIDVIEEEATEDMYRMVGLDEETESEENPLIQAMSRLRWLIATIVGSLTAGAAIKFLTPTDPAAGAALASFIPAIMGLGGGVAIQSATVLIRGLATGEVETADFKDVFRKEFRVVAILGASIAGILFLTSLAWDRAIVLSGIIAVTMMTQCMVAFSLGFSIPVFLKSAGVDPAVAAGPLTQMGCDVSGMVLYFSFAGLALRYFGHL
jgi:magnesium transporter